MCRCVTEANDRGSIALGESLFGVTRKPSIDPSVETRACLWVKQASSATADALVRLRSRHPASSVHSERARAHAPSRLRHPMCASACLSRVHSRKCELTTSRVASHPIASTGFARRVARVRGPLSVHVLPRGPVLVSADARGRVQAGRRRERGRAGDARGRGRVETARDARGLGRRSRRARRPPGPAVRQEQARAVRRAGGARAVPGAVAAVHARVPGRARRVPERPKVGGGHVLPRDGRRGRRDRRRRLGRRARGGGGGARQGRDAGRHRGASAA
jgi:hypothetical protein